MKLCSSGSSPARKRRSMKRRLTQPCPSPPGLQVKYMRLGKSLTPRTQARRLSIFCSDCWVASSTNSTSTSLP